ncbi:MAG: LPS export ABC transporter periplasmic protein LptC [Coxiellaceae bacterium]|nr:LPS export ABC transporter periplasmic protein LptC [Coxiellaceae bacterium]
MKKTVFFSTTAIGILALLWSIYIPSIHHASKTHNPKHTDSYMSGITFFNFDDAGRLTHKITASSANHYPENNRIEYFEPQVIYYNTTGGDWLLRADKGYSIKGKHFVELHDNVKLHRENSDRNPETNLMTDQLIADTSQQILTSEKPVTLQQPHIIITGIGLYGNMKTGIIKTLTNTKTTYHN